METMAERMGVGGEAQSRENNEKKQEVKIHISAFTQKNSK